LTNLSAPFRREKISSRERCGFLRLLLHNINILDLIIAVQEQPRNSRLTATEQREQQRNEQPETTPETAGPTSSIDHEKQPPRRCGRPGGLVG
jgi:hypothetical protein